MNKKTAVVFSNMAPEATRNYSAAMERLGDMTDDELADLMEKRKEEKLRYSIKGDE